MSHGKLLTFPSAPRTLTSGAEALRLARELAEYSQERAGQLLRRPKEARQVRRWETGESPVDPLDLYLELEAIAARVRGRAA